jgi:hypothetical protein
MPVERAGSRDRNVRRPGLEFSLSEFNSNDLGFIAADSERLGQRLPTM